MNNPLMFIVVTLFFLFLTVLTVQAAESSAYQMQKQHLFQPSEAELQQETANQRIYIYEGMKLSDVEKAMDTQFDRIENMMFILTRLPPTASGVEEVENDGCD